MGRRKKIIKTVEKVEDFLSNKEMKIPFVLDKWQEEVLAAEGNLCICSGRQVGKSQIIAIKTAEYIRNNPNKKVLIISITEDQAQNMLQKIVLYLHDNCKQEINMRGINKPTKHRITMKNGAMCVTKAVGQYGLGVLGMTVDVVVPDECAYLPEAIWQSITPMLLTTGGVMWLLSTPNVKEGYFYEAYTDSDMGFQTFHVNSEEVADKRPEPQRTWMINHLAKEKARMTELQYAQQYLAQFLEEQGQLFSDDLIKSLQTLHRPISLPPGGGEYFLGMDIARMGGDEITYEIFERINDKFYQRENLIYQYKYTTETIAKVLELDTLYDFKRIYIDDGGLGVGIFDQLLINDQTKRKIVPINNASRPLDPDKRRKKLLKEDLYLNMLGMMERSEVYFLEDIEIFRSLKSIVKETSHTGEIKIYGRDSHVAEGAIRGLWANRDKDIPLNIYIG